MSSFFLQATFLLISLSIITALPHLQVRDTSFEEIVDEEIQILQLIYGTIDLRLIAAKVPGAETEASSDPIGFPEMMLSFSVPHTQESYYVHRQRADNDRWKWSLPMEDTTDPPPVAWRWEERTSTLEAQLSALRQKGIQRGFHGIILLKPTEQSYQLRWCFVLPGSIFGPEDYEQGDRDFRHYHTRWRSLPQFDGFGSNQSMVEEVS